MTASLRSVPLVGRLEWADLTQSGQIIDCPLLSHLWHSFNSGIGLVETAVESGVNRIEAEAENIIKQRLRGLVV